MPPPAGFRRWKRYWFQCPHCGYRSYEAIGSSAVAMEATGVLWRFWCPRCEGIAQLKRPRRVAAFMLLSNFALFAVLYLFMSALARPGVSMVVVIGGGIAAALAATYYVMPLLSRVFNEYAPAEPPKGS